MLAATPVIANKRTIRTFFIEVLSRADNA